jgi:cell division protein FtsL
MQRLNLLLLGLLMVCALALVTVQFHSRRLTSDLNKEQDLHHRLDEEYRQLQVEQSAWASPKRVSDAATQSLGMRQQDGVNTVVVQVPSSSASLSSGEPKNAGARP